MPQRATVVLTISNRLGLHARPAMVFVDTASRFSSSIVVRRADQPGGPGEPFDGKSIMHMMMLAATQGTLLEVAAEGEDAEQACAELKLLVERGFDEE